MHTYTFMSMHAHFTYACTFTRHMHTYTRLNAYEHWHALKFLCTQTRSWMPMHIDTLLNAYAHWHALSHAIYTLTRPHELIRALTSSVESKCTLTYSLAIKWNMISNPARRTGEDSIHWWWQLPRHERRLLLGRNSVWLWVFIVGYERTAWFDRHEKDSLVFNQLKK